MKLQAADTSGHRSSPQERLARGSQASAVFRENLSWEVSHLPPLTRAEVQSLMELVAAWYAGRTWQAAASQDLKLMWQYAERHGFGGLWGAMVQRGLGFEEKLNQSCRHRYFSNMLHHENCLAICERLQHHARRMGLPLAVMKGPALVVEGYKDAGVRAYSDIDILVDSRQSAFELVLASGAETREGFLEKGVGRRGEHPGRLHAVLNGYELEFCYPIKWNCDPLFDILCRHRARVLKVPDALKLIQALDPGMQVVVLFQHMIRHLCNHFIWFIDLAVFVRSQAERLDWRWISSELDRLQLRNAASLVSGFCNRFIDREFPVLEHGNRGWNGVFQEAMVSLDQMHGGISLFHQEGWRRWFRLFLSPARPFLITDPYHHDSSNNSKAAVWTAGRLMHSLNLEDEDLQRFVRCAATRIFLPIVCFFSKMAARQRPYASANGGKKP